jgi:hypothetical protein
VSTVRLRVVSAFRSEGPDFAVRGRYKYKLLVGAVLDNVHPPDKYGYRAFQYKGQWMKELNAVLAKHTVVERH